jgi:hypothetical protein
MMTLAYSDRSLEKEYPESHLVQFRNCRLLRAHALRKDDFWVRGSTVANPERVFFDERRTADVQIDCQGLILAPSFIDIQINGLLSFKKKVNSSISSLYQEVSVSISRLSIHPNGKKVWIKWLMDFCNSE